MSLARHASIDRPMTGSPPMRMRLSLGRTVADHWAALVRHRVVDGFNINPYHLRDAIGDLVDKLVPALQERGVFRTEYTSTTLRGHLGLDGDAASDRARAS